MKKGLWRKVKGRDLPYLEAKSQRFLRSLSLLLIIVLLVLMVAPSVGKVWLNPFNLGEEAAIYWQLRVPRVLLAALSGAGLALGGVVFQAILRNPLAEPFILGIASGAALGAASVIYFGVGLSFTLLFLPLLSLSAFIGATLVAIILYLFAIRREADRLRLLLMGVIISLFASSLMMLLQSLGDPSHALSLMRWMMGSFAGADGAKVLLAGSVLPLWLIIYRYGRALNLLRHGQIMATTRGVNSRKVIAWLFIWVSLLTAILVSISGPIGFVGLIIPHIARQWFGGDHRQLLLAAPLLGAIFLVLADLLGQWLFMPAEIPVSVITALLGAPFFLLLLLKPRA